LEAFCIPFQDMWDAKYIALREKELRARRFIDLVRSFMSNGWATFYTTGTNVTRIV